MSRLLARIVLCFTFLVATAPTYAASVTFDAPFCSGFSVSGTGPNYTLTCETMACSAYLFVEHGAAGPADPDRRLLSRHCGDRVVPVVGQRRPGCACRRRARTTSSRSPRSDLHLPRDRDRDQRRQGQRRRQRRVGQHAGRSALLQRAVARHYAEPDDVRGRHRSLNVSCTGTGITYAWRRTAPTAGTLGSSATASDSLAANTTSSGITYTYVVDACTGPTSASCSSQTVSVVVPSTGGGGGGVAERACAPACPTWS